MRSNAETVNLVTLFVKTDDGVFIDVIAGNNLKVFKPLQFKAATRIVFVFSLNISL